MKVSIGRTVHYVDNDGNHWPMVVLAVHPLDKVSGKVMTLVGDVVKHGVSFSEDKEKDTWHWPEREETELEKATKRGASEIMPQ